ncbi:MAG: phosphoglycerate dehydrogenase [bacterium]
MKILVSDPIADEGLKILRSERDIQVDVKTKLPPEDLRRIIGEYDALIVRSETRVTKEIIEAGSKLKVIGRAGVGLDNVDVKEATRRGIIVMNTPDGNTISTAELTISMMLALSRNIPQAYISLRSGKWDRKSYTGTEVYNKTLGIIGLGRIGGAVAKRAQGLGMRVIGYDPYISEERSTKLEVKFVDLPTLYRESDYITVHTPLTEETKGLIGEKEFAQMKRGVRIINCARGGIVDEKALYNALKSGKVAGAALDVYNIEPPVGNPLLELDNVIATPHLGASTAEAQTQVSIDIAKQVLEVLRGGMIVNAVNFPSVEPSVLSTLQPYIDLAESLGKIITQMSDGFIRELKIRYSGEVTTYNTQPISVALLKGMLEPIMQEGVNYVNAPYLVRERGTAVREITSREVGDYSTQITVEAKTDTQEVSVAGTLFDKTEPRIVRLMNHHVDAKPFGHMLVILNEDKPRIIGEVGITLGDAGINIADMTLGRIKAGGRAVTVLNLDSEVPDDVFEKIKSLKNIIEARRINL